MRVDLAGWRVERQHAARLIWRAQKRPTSEACRRPRILSDGARGGADRSRELRYQPIYNVHRHHSASLATSGTIDDRCQYREGGLKLCRRQMLSPWVTKGTAMVGAAVSSQMEGSPPMNYICWGGDRPRRLLFFSIPPYCPPTDSCLRARRSALLLCPAASSLATSLHWQVLDINKGDDTIDWIGQGALHRPFSSSNRHPHHANGDFLPGIYVVFKQKSPGE